MKLLLLLSLVGLAVGQAIISKPEEANDVGEREQAVYQEPQEGYDEANDKKVDKRSYGWSPWIWPTYSIGHGHGWPSIGHGWSSGHGWSGHGWNAWPSYGWPIWPSYGHGWHGSSHGWHGGHSGWHGGHGGWHSKW